MLVATSDRQVVGREDELAHLRDFVAAVAQGPRALCIRGEPGIGKTTLWRAAIEGEASIGRRVLSARCVEAELPRQVEVAALVAVASPARLPPGPATRERSVRARLRLRGVTKFPRNGGFVVFRPASGALALDAPANARASLLSIRSPR